MDGGAEESNRFWAAIMKPEFVVVSAQETNTTAASGAIAPAHSASTAASISAFPGAFVPGSAHPVPENDVRPNAERKVATSAGLMSEISSTATVCPLPVIGLLAV